jgi:hypothetical protein
MTKTRCFSFALGNLGHDTIGILAHRIDVAFFEVVVLKQKDVVHFIVYSTTAVPGLGPVALSLLPSYEGV